MTTEPDQAKADPNYRECLFSVDTEFSGPTPGRYSLLSIGAVVVGDHSKRFYVELKPLPGALADPKAMAVNKLSLAALETSGKEPGDAMRAFGAWVLAVKTGRAVFVSFGTCDWVWVQWYFGTFTETPYGPFGPNTLDIKSYFMGHAKADLWNLTTKKRIPKELQWDGVHSHNALEDSVEQAILFEKIRATGRQVA